MRALIVLLFIALFSYQLLAENIDECKTDIYFANGVGAVSKDASFNQGEEEISKYIISTPSIQDFIGKYDLAFNTGHGVALDFFEAWLQYTDENPSANFGWEAFKTAIGRLTVIGGGAVELSAAVARTHEANDISKQVKAYEESIKLGHGVLVLAHSQGNFFTNKAYNSDGGIAPWMRDYFKTVGLASPSDIKIPHSSYLTYDNDPISALNGAGEIIRNPMRYYEWLAGPNAIVDSSSTVPCASVTIADGDTPICNDADWYAEDNSLDDFHAFGYYMQTSATQTDIYKYLTDAIEFHNGIFTLSQWETDQELNKNTKEYRITVKHRFDSSIIAMNGIEVYPFAPSKKLYYIQGEFSENISGYVKASCGGYLLEDTWVGQVATEFKRLVHTDTMLPHEILSYRCDGQGYLVNSGTRTCEYYDYPYDVEINIASTSDVQAKEIMFQSQSPDTLCASDYDWSEKAVYYYPTYKYNDVNTQFYCSNTWISYYWDVSRNPDADVLAYAQSFEGVTETGSVLIDEDNYNEIYLVSYTELYNSYVLRKSVAFTDDRRISFIKRRSYQKYIFKAK